jgi:hypothetical protein
VVLVSKSLGLIGRGIFVEEKLDEDVVVKILPGQVTPVKYNRYLPEMLSEPSYSVTGTFRKCHRNLPVIYVTW